jgi:hypothetical protein
MGQLLYSGKWAIEPNVEVDYIINYQYAMEQRVSVDEVFLDLEQAAAVLAGGSSTAAAVPVFSRVLNIGDRAYCPIEDFMARAARKTAKSSRVFKVSTDTGSRCCRSGKS